MGHEPHAGRIWKADPRIWKADPRIWKADPRIWQALFKVAVEKLVAADAVLELFEYTKASFIPYLETSIKSLTPLLTHFYPTTRKATATTLLSFISTAHEISDSPKFEPGFANIKMLDDVCKLVDLIIPKIMSLWRGEEKCDVVSDLCSSLSSIISTVGAGVVALTYLDEARISHWQSLLIGSAADLVGTFATVLGANFAQVFQQFLPAVSKYYNPCYSSTDQKNTIGLLAEVINGLGSAVSPFTEDVLTLGVKATKDDDVEVRSNAAFFLGLLAYWTTVDISSQYLSILKCLQPLFIVPNDASREKSKRAKDNAAGAVARMILKNKAALPKCFEALFDLIQMSHPLVRTHFDHILAVFAHVLQNSVPAVPKEKVMIPAETREQLVAVLRQLNSQVPNQLAACGLTAYIQ
ncbi:hypothetical protein PCANC_25290 [Puccinia coronata f. sp. avenae]|uniref:TOG domain-containing protein n=1 Tax=Puccinia coronata f. sp. avenae TaxID=200324 RepID=A0A2N5TWS8_9BASI|nr:hypothetical protein PCANC_25290 [Puccinia coronata f. sp. avenae]